MSVPELSSVYNGGWFQLKFCSFLAVLSHWMWWKGGLKVLWKEYACTTSNNRFSGAVTAASVSHGTGCVGTSTG